MSSVLKPVKTAKFAVLDTTEGAAINKQTKSSEVIYSLNKLQ